MSRHKGSRAHLAPANTILGQVERQVRNARVRIAMLMAPYLEGGGPSPLGAGGWGVGDNGNSHGAYQINLPYHPGVTAAEADNPAFAVGYMRSRYAAAARQVPAALWASNPTLAEEETIQKAENPAESYYASHGTGAVNAAYANAVKASTGAPPAAAPPYPWPLPANMQHGKLTAAERRTMIAYIRHNPTGAHGQPINGGLLNSLPTMSDVMLRWMYGGVVSAHSGTASPGKIAGDLASGAANALTGGLFGNWSGVIYKAAFAVGGIALVVVGGAAAAKGTPAGKVMTAA